MQLLSITHLRSIERLGLALLLVAVSYLPYISYALVPEQSAKKDFGFIEPRFELMRDAETLDDQIITALAQDARGFIWIGTQEGLVRYDGYRFRQFSHRANAPSSLAANYVYSLFAARDGRIWVGTRSDGVSVFDPQTENFEHFQHDKNKANSLTDGIVRAITDDGKGGMWIATEQGLNHLSADRKQLTNFKPDTGPDSLSANSVSSLLMDAAGRLWVGSARGLQRLGKDGKSFETVIADKDITTLYQASDGKLWVGSGTYGAAWLMANSDASQALQVHWLDTSTIGNTWVSGIAEGRQGEIWLATYGGGITIVDASDGQLLQIVRADPSSPGSLSYDDLKPLLKDRSGWLWIGTWGAGLQRVNVNSDMVKILKHSPKRANGLSHPDISSIVELQDRRLLLGTSGNGIDIIDRKRGLVGRYRASKGQPSTALLPDGVISALAQTRDGTVWVGTQEAGVVRMRVGTDIWEKLMGLPDPQVRKLLASREGSLWVGTDHGIARWQSGTRFETFSKEDGSSFNFAVFALAEDSQHRIWIGTDHGLWLHEPGRSTLRQVSSELSGSNGLISDYIQGLLIDRKDRLWVSTDKGLDRMQQWDGERAQFEHISVLLKQVDKGVGSNLLEDSEGRIWTEDVMFDPTTLHITHLSTVDGIDPHTSWNGSYTKTHDGLLLFGGTKGVAIIDPTRYKKYEYVPALVVTELKVNGQTVAPGSLASLTSSKDTELLLSSTQRDFSIEFSVFDFSDPKKNQYQYRLQGYDKNWVDTDADHRIAAYTNLWPGNYYLQVRGSNYQGDWSQYELMIPIKVLPLWWQTWGVLVLGVVLSGALIVLVLRWRVRRLREKARRLQTLIDASTADILNIGEIGRELTSTLDTEQAFDRVYRQVIARLNTEIFFIAIVDEDSAHLSLVYKIEAKRRFRNTIVKLDEDRHPAVLCVRKQKELIIRSREELSQYSGKLELPPESTLMETMVYLPLFAGQKVIACLSVQSEQVDAYNKDQLEFLRILASYTAIALSNSTAHDKLAKSHEELADALHYLKAAQAKLIQAERQQISLDLHDNLSQTMTGILLQLDTARDVLIHGNERSPSTTTEHSSQTSMGDNGLGGLPYVDRAIELARDGIAQTRYVLKQLRMKKNATPPVDLVNTLRHDLARLTEGTPVKVHVDQSGHPISLHAKLELAFLNIAQQAVTNALRHSGAKTIKVLIAYHSDHVVLTVRDDGCGFDLAGPEFTPGIGIFGMKERVAALAGKFYLASAIGKGTKVTASIPFLEEDQ